MFNFFLGNNIYKWISLATSSPRRNQT
jgi:hypothetical protein